jgi:hypothetical protein
MRKTTAKSRVKNISPGEIIGGCVHHVAKTDSSPFPNNQKPYPELTSKANGKDLIFDLHHHFSYLPL